MRLSWNITPIPTVSILNIWWKLQYQILNLWHSYQHSSFSSMWLQSPWSAMTVCGRLWWYSTRSTPFSSENINRCAKRTELIKAIWHLVTILKRINGRQGLDIPHMCVIPISICPDVRLCLTLNFALCIRILSLINFAITFACKNALIRYNFN